ncbi:MAG: glycosyltransferase family 2 protein [Gammaproteobacteria bacterium]|nr:glycosyltransferase family 2 protein [Gammaproteobacteria bacterium]MBD3776044.1 glycosyltransferase family 2 protein [Thiotrichales bacterium]
MTQPLSANHFAIIIPAYNEAQTIREVVKNALQHTPHVIVVNDASQDATAQIVQQTAAILIEHTQNQGKAAALQSGFTKARQLNVDYAITLDGDGQHDPHNIPQLQDAYAQHPHHLVVAARLQNRENAPKARLMANKIADFWVSWAAGKPIADSQSGFRLYPFALLERLSIRPHRRSGFVFESEVLIEAAREGFDFVFVPIASSYPEQRRPSHFRPGFDITQITLMVARKLLKKGLYLPGLFRSLTHKPNIFISSTTKETL